MPPRAWAEIALQGGRRDIRVGIEESIRCCHLGEGMCSGVLVGSVQTLIVYGIVTNMERITVGNKTRKGLGSGDEWLQYWVRVVAVKS